MPHVFLSEVEEGNEKRVAAPIFGDILYSNNVKAWQALSGNITTTRKFLRQTGDGSLSAAPVWDTLQAGDLPGSFGGFANPTASLGLTAINGTATTAMRSDGAPALSQSIAPTWTGIHTFASTKLKIAGDTSGTLTFAVPAIAGTNTLTFPAGTTDFSATGATGAVVRQASAGAAFTVSALTLASSDFANQGTTTTVLHGNAVGNPSFGAVSLTADVSGILPGANGGTNNAFFQISGPATTLKTFTFPNADSTITTGTGTSGRVMVWGASNVAADSNYILSGATSARTYTFPDVNSTLLSTGNAFANPTASLGLAAVNGSATTAMRSDGAPALSQAITPTWTGLHTFSTVTLATPTVNSLLISRWTRARDPGIKFGNAIDVLLGSYGTDVNSQSRVDLKLANGADDLPDTIVLTLTANTRLGVGTTAPFDTIQGNGTISARTTTSTDGYVTLTPGDATNVGYTAWFKPGPTRIGYMGFGTTGNLGLVLEAGATFSITGGNTYLATLYGGSAANDDITIEGTSHGTKTTSYVILQPTSGNVGIGTTGPGNKLDVFIGSAASDGIVIRKTAVVANQTAGFMLFDSNHGMFASTDGAGTNKNELDFKEYGGVFKFINSNTSAELMRINNGNVGIGTTSFGTSAAGVLAIGLGTVPSTSPADMIQIYPEDLSAGNTTLGLRTETSVASDVALASTHSLSIRINGATYKLMLVAV